ncbi:MAG: phosphoribosylglycinamide formyltransferase [Lachnospiraceae bacterium]|nr:phosphoribosylglycinamide formyltransferase [Lachnospiraceae bacterium]MBQ6026896.1 phosphoribosylglycinamide formyltransferase [Lachnospiraceae bacterium]
MPKTKIAVLVSGGGTNLQALIDAEKAGKIPHGEIALVVASKPGVFALERAAKAGIKSVVVERKKYPDKPSFEADLKKTLDENGIQMIILAGFMLVLSADFVKQYPDRIINVHPALIPSFCGDGFYGLHVHEAVLNYGVKVTGATVHFVNEVTDGGKIILQKAVDVLDGDTPEVLQKRVMEQAEWIILPQATEIVAKQLSEA